MKIKFNKVLDLGSSENERIVFDVLEDCNIGTYLLALSDKLDDSKISSKIENVFWLRDKVVKKGDLVVVYTCRKGSGIHTLENQSGVESHFLFWNLEDVLAKQVNKKVVYLESTWSTLDIIQEQSTDAQSEGI